MDRAAAVDAARFILDALRAEGVTQGEIEMLFQIQRSDIAIPVGVLSNRSLGALEAITVYMKEHHNLSYHEIAVLLKRDDRTIWATYNNAKQKLNGANGK